MDSNEDKIFSNRIIWYFCIIGFFAIFSTSISKNPVLPLYAGSLGADETFIGIICAISPIAGILFSFPIGVLSDKFGRRRLLIIAALVIVLAPLLYLFISNPLWLIPIRFFHGTATATLTPVISAVIAEKFGSQKGVMIGTYSSATLFGRTLAPLIGGAILTLFAFLPGNSSYQFVYIAAFLAGIPVFMLTMFFKEKTYSSLPKIHITDFSKSLSKFLKNQNLRRASIAQMITYFCFGAFETFLPVYLLTKGIDAWLVGVIFGIQVLVLALTKPYFGKLADKGRLYLQMVVGMVLSGVAIGSVTLTIEITSLFFVSIVFGIGMSLTSVAANVCAANTADKNQLGASLGTLSSIMDIGHASGPFVSGLVITVFGFSVGFFLCLILSVTAAIYIGTGKGHV